jgi:predicted DNA-binding protein YlxM (UPF0122 family)
MNSTVGRPRSLTDAQVAAILEWHRNRKSFKRFARELEVSEATIRNCIKCCGQYKQASPELLSVAREMRRRRFLQLVAANLA